MKLGVAWTVDRDGSIHCMLHIPRRTRVGRAVVRFAAVLSVAVLELPATWGNPRAALGHVDVLLASLPATDLVLLPELSLTGYVSPQRSFDVTPFGEPLDGETAAAIATLARKHRIHLVAPLVLREEGSFSNAMLGFDLHGALAFVYRKRHPWFPETWATAGQAPPPSSSSAIFV